MDENDFYADDYPYLCTDCEGEGEVYFEDAGWGVCPTCGGTGRDEVCYGDE